MRATLYTDGGSRGNPGPAGIGFVLTIDGEKIEGSDFIGEATNNQAEYRALLAGLERAQQENVSELHVCMDSELIVKQVRGEYRVKHVDLKPLYEKVKLFLNQFAQVSFVHVRREKNKEADALVNKAIDRATKK